MTVVASAVSEKKNIAVARKRIAEMLTDLRERDVDSKEFSDTRNFIRGVYLLDHQTISRQAWYLGWWEIMGPGHEYDDIHLQRLMAVTPADLRNAAQKYFSVDPVKVEITPE